MNWLIYFVIVCLTAICGSENFEYECGLEETTATPLVRGGQTVGANEFPWQVAIFQKIDKRFVQICGGSLVRSELVITAAHCFSDELIQHQIKVEDYRVVAGSLFSSWTARPPGKQTRQVRAVRLGKRYGGLNRNFQNDIAVVHLQSGFTFSPVVRAVCLDLMDEELHNTQTSQGSVGKVAGWGLTESGIPSNKLMFLRIPVLGDEQCALQIFNTRSSYISKLTADKICAGLNNGSAVCRGDSGAGLVFPLENTDTSLPRWYLRGLLSNTASSSKVANDCPMNDVALYTNVFTHRRWLSTIMEKFQAQEGCRVMGSVGVCREYSACPGAMGRAALGILPQYCSPSSTKICCVESVETRPPLPFSAHDDCGLEDIVSQPLVRGGKRVISREFPWQVAIFSIRSFSGDFEQICGGSLVRSQLVITAAHCFSTEEDNHMVDLSAYRVVGGSLQSSWTTEDIEGRQQSEVRAVRLGENYRGHKHHFQYDIAIVHLGTEFIFSPVVRAVCLDLVDRELHDSQTSPGSVGKVASWGLTESGTLSNRLNFLKVPVVEKTECYRQVPVNFRSHVTADKICAGLTNGSAMCPGDGGGGLVFPLQDKITGLWHWYLRAILSNAPISKDPMDQSCQTKYIALYSNIFSSRTWLSINMEQLQPQKRCWARGSVGSCENFINCPAAMVAASHGILPQYCSPSSTKICCVESVETRPPLPSSAVSQRKTGSMAHD